MILTEKYGFLFYFFANIRLIIYLLLIDQQPSLNQAGV